MNTTTNSQLVLKRNIKGRGWLTVETSTSIDVLMSTADRKMNEVLHGKYKVHNGLEFESIGLDDIRFAIFQEDTILIPASDVLSLSSEVAC